MEAILEAIRVLYDLQRINYDKVIRYFSKIHDLTQTNGQGHVLESNTRVLF
nr:peptide-methionine (S)-S-oxide reductase [Coxiella-like endosymbiont]